MEGINREEGLVRFKGNIPKGSQHYIVYHFLQNDISEAADDYGSGKLLDIGCGNKPYLGYFKKIESYTGCDIVQSSENLVDYLCPANKLCFEKDSFDTVFSTQVMEHVADFHGMISETFRVLKPGGYAIFTVPFSWELHEEPYDFYRYTKYSLKENFTAAGFEVIKLKANGGKWAAIFQLNLNILMSTRKYKTLRSRLIALFLVKLRMMYLYNKLAIWLDKKYYDEILTLNYLIVLKKKVD